MTVSVGSAVFPRNEAGTEVVGFGVPGVGGSSGGRGSDAGRGGRSRI